MADIPEDIQRAAREAWVEIADTHDSRIGFPECVIARALLAERERCAALARPGDKVEVCKKCLRHPFRCRCCGGPARDLSTEECW